jgi:hypothetical protein
MPSWAWALLGGAIGSGVVLAVVLPPKLAQLNQRGQALQQQVQAGQGVTATQIAAMRARLQTFAQTSANTIARASGDAYLMQGYGLNQDRMQRLQALAARFGIH